MRRKSNIWTERVFDDFLYSTYLAITKAEYSVQ